MIGACGERDNKSRKIANASHADGLHHFHLRLVQPGVDAAALQ